MQQESGNTETDNHLNVFEMVIDSDVCESDENSDDKDNLITDTAVPPPMCISF